VQDKGELKMAKTTNRKAWLVTAALLFGFVCFNASAVVIYVDASAAGDANGSSWTNAYNYLQDALTDANLNAPAEIWVAQGTYRPDEDTAHPTGTGSRTVTFQLIDGVAIYGGFPSGGGAWESRDPNTYKTILSGDLGENDEPNFVNHSDNSYHVVTGSGTEPNAVLDGFTIIAGYASGLGPPVIYRRGGGMYSDDGSQTVANCTFRDNWAVFDGGGVWNINGTGTFTNCSFTANSANGDGAGIWLAGPATFTNCTFSENSAGDEGGGIWCGVTLAFDHCTFTGNSAGDSGGGIYNYQGSPTLTNCVFTGNSVLQVGGGMYNYDGADANIVNCTFTGNSSTDAFGGGISNYNSHPNIVNCTFSSNSARWGGGMYNAFSSPTMTNCILNGNLATQYGGGIFDQNNSSPILTNCTFTANTGTFTGGGMSNYDGSSPILTNCTFIGNSTTQLGGAMHNQGNVATLTNCTLIGNSAAQGGGLNNLNTEDNIILTNCIVWGNTAATGAQIYNNGSSTDASYCDIQGWWEGDTNIDEDPLFWDTKGHILNISPCKNAGDSNGNYSGQTDMDGQPRVMDGGVDIGADEVPPSIQNIDTNEVYTTIQQAINAAYNGQTIVVQPGTYSGAGNRGINFNGKSITLRCAEPNDFNAVAATVIDCTNYETAGVYFQNGEGPNSVLAGFTIINAYGDTIYGGGVNCYQSSPTIKNCILKNNTGYGIYCSGGAGPTINGGTIRDNIPDGIYIDAASSVRVLGTLHIISNDIVGQGSVRFGPGGNLDLDDAHVFCGISGAGTMQVALGAQATVDGNSVIDLADPCDPNIRGTIDCQGLLKVVETAKITNAQINITKAVFKDKAEIKNCEISVNSKAPYGQVFAEPNTSFTDVNIYADGDRYMDLDPSIFDGNFVNVRIFVTVTEGVGKPFGGLFECRGDDGLADVNSFDPNNPFFIKANPGTIQDCNLATWTLEKLELVAGAKLNLTNRFPFQPPYDQEIDYNDVVYVKELILRQGSVLNLAFNKLYYDTLIMEPNAVVENVPLLGFSMINIALDDQTEFLVRVTHNNYTGSNEPNYNRVHIERVTGLSPDPNGMMRMRTLKDQNPCSPTYEQDVNACAKGMFVKTSETEDIAVEFEYMFTADPCGDAELVVYLSDDPELGQNLREVARLRPPAPGRPGSIGSGSFAVFSGLFPPEGFNFIRGTYIELRLVGSAGAICLINNWDPRVNCVGICGDFNIEEPFPLNIVNIYDYLVLLAEYGLSGPGSAGKGCLDLVTDGCVNNNDVLAWGVDELLNRCPGSGAFFAPGSNATRTAKLAPGVPANHGAAESEPLLICGKPATGLGAEVPDNCLYSVNTVGVCNDISQTNGSGRLVTDGNGSVYQIDAHLGLVNLTTQTTVVEPDVIAYEGNLVSVGFSGAGGLLLSDAVFKPDDSNIVYIVPVQVDPQDGNCPYMAAAKLQLTGAGHYNLLLLYGKNPAEDPCQNNTVTDCGGDFVYEPDVQHLHEIEIDYEGNLFVLSSHLRNENAWLLIYDEAIGNDSEVRLPLGNTGISGPTAMVVSLFRSKLYLASSVNTSDDLVSNVYQFVVDKTIPGHPNLTPAGIVEINCPAPSVCDSYPSMCNAGLGYIAAITSMTEKPSDGTLYVTGFTAPKFPDNVTTSSWPYNQAGGIFTTPMLAEIERGTSGMIEAMNIVDSNLVLPSSLVWTEPVALPNCGGADIDESGDVGLADLAVLVSYWLETACGTLDDCHGADLQPQYGLDGDVDMADFAVLAENWLQTGCSD
jgi:parallel beta-helix repeat protein